MHRNLNIKIEYISSIFKFIYLIHIMLASCFYLANTPILQITSTIVLVLGFVVLLYRLFHLKRIIKYPFIILYIIFMISYLITTVANVGYGWYDNIKIMIWMTLQFGVVYLFDRKYKSDYYRKEFFISMTIIVIVTSVMNIISVLMLLCNYFGYYEPVKDTVYLVGVAPWGRLYGIYVDPNYSCVLSVIALMTAIYLLSVSKKRAQKILLIISMIFQALFISCCASRTGLVTICVCVVSCSFLYFLKNKKKVYKAILFSFLLLILTVGSNKLIVEGYNFYVTTPVAEQLSAFVYGLADDQKEMTKIGRDEELEGDISNRRFDLWKNACDIVKTSPVIGISFGNIVPYTEDKVPDSYLLTNGYIVFNAFHNMFIDLFASQGILGCIIFLLIICCSLLFLLKNIKDIPEDNTTMCIFLFSTCTGVICSSLFVSEILYVHNQVTVLFWTLWGYLIYFVDCSSKQKEKE